MKKKTKPSFGIVLETEDCTYEIGGKKVSEYVFYKAIAAMIKEKNKKNLK